MEKVATTLTRFTEWLNSYGETSWDHQSFFAGPLGRRAKSCYYRYPKLGLMAVAPMIFFEALLPAGRRLFHQRIRFPIADAHYAMAFAFLHQATEKKIYLERAVHFLRVLQKSRSPGFVENCWGYPFDWVLYPVWRRWSIKCGSLPRFFTNKCCASVLERYVRYNCETKPEFCPGKPEQRWLVVLCHRSGARLCRPLSYVFRDEGVGENLCAHRRHALLWRACHWSRVLSQELIRRRRIAEAFLQSTAADRL